MPSLLSSLVLSVEIGVLAAFHKIGASMRRDPASAFYVFGFWYGCWKNSTKKQPITTSSSRKGHVWVEPEELALVLREPNMRTGAIQLSAPKASHKPLTKTLKTIYERF